MTIGRYTVLLVIATLPTALLAIGSFFPNLPTAQNEHLNGSESTAILGLDADTLAAYVSPMRANVCSRGLGLFF
jgi:hypothetical protein